MNLDNALLDHPLKISEVNTLIASTLKEGFYNLSLEGEISGFKPSSSGHFYFSLKDEKSKISAIMFKTRQYNLDFRPQDGDLVTVWGSIEVYIPYGTYQIIIDRMVKKGDGDLLAQIEKLKQYYQNLGYFDLKNKKPIPQYPKKLVVITALTGAAVRDILHITSRRAPLLDIVILPTLVQGEMADKMISERIRQADIFQLGDLIILGRGGGSSEDLSCFSSAKVIEAIHNCSIPIISAVGHENDWALSDYVADLRASTPSAAAELATKGYQEVKNRLNSATMSVNAEMKNRILKTRFKIEKTKEMQMNLKSKVNSIMLSLSFWDENNTQLLENKLIRYKTMIKNQYGLINSKMYNYLSLVEKDITNKKDFFSYHLDNIYKKKLALLKAERTKIEAFNPYSVLKRGYSILTDENGNIIKNSKTVKPGLIIKAQLNEGRLVLKNIGEE